MRVFKFAIAALIVIEIFVLAMPESRYSARVFGQVVIGGPATPVPLTPPPAPGAPQALSTIGAIPQLAPAPGSTNVLAAAAAATPRSFRCTCSGPGYATQWAGVVAASSYVLASQTASAQCQSYKLNGHALSPFINPPSANSFAPPPAQPPGGLYSSPPGQVTTQGGNQYPDQPISNGLRQQAPAQCMRCACN